MFVSIAQLFYGQEKYTIQAEKPEKTQDGKKKKQTETQKKNIGN